MKLSNEVKEKIKSFNLNLGEIEFDEAHEKTMDYLLDEEIVDLSDDDDGDLYEELSNLVYDFLESELNEG